MSGRGRGRGRGRPPIAQYVALARPFLGICLGQTVHPISHCSTPTCTHLPSPPPTPLLPSQPGRRHPPVRGVGPPLPLHLPGAAVAVRRQPGVWRW
ncbi:unnamed protein product [Closterium sp. NIES-53]